MTGLIWLVNLVGVTERCDGKIFITCRSSHCFSVKVPLDGKQYCAIINIAQYLDRLVVTLKGCTVHYVQ